MIMLVAALNAPLVGVSDDDATTLHRINMDGLPLAEWETATHSAAVCGESVRLLAVADNQPLPWEWLRTRGTRYKRCQTCNGRRGA